MGDGDLHPACVKKIFQTKELPKLDYTKEQLDGLALQIIQERTALTGVQPKLSLHMREYAEGKRLTIVGLWGGYICKPQSALYAMMPEVEDMCQLTERQREHKCRGSYERVRKTILRYSLKSKMDVINFFELVLFSWLTGNNDIHLKTSHYTTHRVGYVWRLLTI